ncbi:carnitine acyl carnitine carrier [Moniliophthora roreri]|uniref:FAS1 domain-containing protein n=1 Tax=Moniliophthora roreri TaxID=221103 RepID=A0A0W0FGX4_MONRR|nr:carnitine acyl carnitine carrier [Moniliophthora roreri]
MHLLSLSIFLFLPYFSWGSQSVLEINPTSSLRTTLIDCLNNDSDYLSLLMLIQQANLVPTLNRLNGSTLFAPTNDAIERYRSSNPLWNSILDDSNTLVNDNVREGLRQQLFYHLLNYSVAALPHDEEPLQVLETLHFPHKHVDPPTHEPPPYPPWLPIPGGTLGGKPQRLRVAARAQKAFVGVDAFGEGGSEVVKGQTDCGNGVLFGIADVLEPPPDLATVVSQHSDVSYFNNVLTSEITKLLNSTPGLTVFLPINKAWEALDEYERLYLESRYATDDLNRILNMHAVAEDGVKWSDTFDPAVNLTTIDGRTLEIIAAPQGTMVSTAKLVRPDIYASNGVLHFVDSLLIPDGALKLTPEKYLLTLNCTKFVSLIHDADLTHLINDTEAKYTILAPGDDVIALFGDKDLPEPGSEDLKKMLQYHFLPGKFTPSKLKSGMLVETALEEKGLHYHKQVLTVEASDGGGKDNSWKSLRFGGATVLREPVEVNNTLIYFISKTVTPPSDALETVLPMLDLSSFIAALLSTSVKDMLRSTPRTTLLIPNNEAFKRLGHLVSEHLLAASNKADLEKVLLHHTLVTVQYSKALQNGTKHSFATLEDSDLTLSRKEDGRVYVSPSGGWAGMKSELFTHNILTQTGVIHELSDVLIPRSVDLTVGKLVKAAGGSTMASMLTKAGFEWVLNGTAPPEGSPWADQGLESAGWTLLCPPDDAFDDYNITELFSDKDRLVMVVSQHLIPAPRDKKKKDISVPLDDDPLNNNKPLKLDNSVTYSTLRSPSSAYGDIVFKADDEAKGGYIVGIKDARGTDGTSDWAQVESWGRSTTGGGTGGVIRIDRLLIPYQPPWWLEYGAPIVVGVLGVFLICGFFYVVRLIWRRDTTEATYEPVGGFARDDDEES